MILLIMETKKCLSQILGIKKGSHETSKGIKNTATFFAVGVLALVALGVFTTSQRLNAG
jgi:hypothetical protein